jgi:hypothetical protein
MVHGGIAFWSCSNDVCNDVGTQRVLVPEGVRKAPS